MTRTRDDRSKFLRVLAEKPYIYYASKKAGISRATIYRWMKDNIDFKTEVERSIKEGRTNLCEAVEMVLVKKATDGHFQSIKYYLAHNNPKYRPQRATWPPPAFTSEQLEMIQELHTWTLRNKPIPQEKREQIIHAMRRWGWIDPEGNPSDEFKETLAKVQGELISKDG